MMIAASFAVPPAVRHAIDQGRREASIRAMRLPPLVPRVPGYKLADAYPVQGTLAVDMVAARVRRDQFGADEHIAFTVTISTPGDQYLDVMLRRCQRRDTASRRGSGPCHPLRPGLWEIQPAPGGPASAIGMHGRIIAFAFAQPTSQSVPIGVLATAVTNLHHVSVSQLLTVEY